MNITATNNSPNFEAVKFSPAKLEKWPKEILDTVLDSKALKDTIKENEKNGTDTIVKLHDTRKEVSDYLMSTDPDYSRFVALNIMNGENIAYSFCESGKVWDGAKLIQNVVDQASEALKPQTNNASLESKLADLKKIAASVIYE